MKQRLTQLTQSSGAWHGLIMAGATLFAGGFDYIAQVFMGRLLLPTEYIILVAVTALLQVIVQATNVIRNVVAFYTAEQTAQPESFAPIAGFVQKAWRWAWLWGSVATAVMALLSPLLARFLRIPTPWPVLAGSSLLLLLFLRPVTDGALQGIQGFVSLGAVQVVQAVLRLALAVLLIRWGWQSVGAILSLPLASAGALLVAVWALWPYFQHPRATAVPAINWNYSLQTLLGLLAFAVMVNLDALLVQRLFPAEIAGSYAPVVTLGKMNLFIPLGLGLVLFPKATQRQAAGKDPRPVLLLALAATLGPGLALTAVYFLWPAFLVGTVFGGKYANPGTVLGLVGLATTLYAGVNIWLNYALSIERPLFVYLLGGLVALQAIAMSVYHPSLQATAVIMVLAALSANFIGGITTLTLKTKGIK